LIESSIHDKILEMDCKYSSNGSYIGHQQEVLKLLKENLPIAQNMMKQQADQNRNEMEFEVGDWVFVR